MTVIVQMSYMLYHQRQDLGITFSESQMYWRRVELLTVGVEAESLSVDVEPVFGTPSICSRQLIAFYWAVAVLVWVYLPESFPNSPSLVKLALLLQNIDQKLRSLVDFKRRHRTGISSVFESSAQELLGLVQVAVPAEKAAKLVVQTAKSNLVLLVFWLNSLFSEDALQNTLGL